MDLVLKKGSITELVVDTPPAYSINDGEIIVAIEKFVLTSNIVSYATAGESLGYFKFFPSQTGNRIPTWGYGVVLVSRSKSINIGDKLYGYFPMSKYLTLKPGNIGTESFVDLSEHRKSLPAVYNSYSICSKAVFYKPLYEDLTIILRPLYITGWFLADFVEEMKNFGANNVIITSASSKTSIGAGFEVKQQTKYPTIGLTSERNVEFVKSLGVYDRVMSYSDIKALDKSDSFIIIDMAGNTSLVNEIQETVGENLKYICAVGNTHWEESDGKKDMKAFTVKPNFFFAPTQIAKRMKEWGPQKLGEKLNVSWLHFVKQCHERKWLAINNTVGKEDVLNAFSRLAKGQVKPNEAVVCSLWNTGELPPFARI